MWHLLDFAASRLVAVLVGLVVTAVRQASSFRVSEKPEWKDFQTSEVRFLVLAARLVLSHVEEKHILLESWICIHIDYSESRHGALQTMQHVGTVQVQSYLAYAQKHQLYLRPVWLLSLLSSDGDTMPTNRALTADRTWQAWAWHVWLVKATRKIRQKPRSHGPHGPHTVQVLAQNLL